ncbi:MAG: MoxR family ATPase [Chloroflexi bacterium]|jgi:MoxR-like ATPase|uniref:AAA family ATPase n=1 Tax=Candidatus Thermofonsia Clade 3 bacterium TaxID=2364212 RepID=A0A2M8QGA5_9CHLR|nr:MoxR family ATPase [Candidatus Roseilinea sp. NK_OTU-006]PJF48782.1 MAG: AAA family ATPase [Candidatus Thermofonsia Clade 3 bacterium]RMG63613.1 MAG: MoxR family ATPase [Chloroflexota bacterium]
MADASPITPEKFTEVAQQIEKQVSSVIIGQQDIIRHTLIAIIAGGHVLLEGVPGLGKTSLVRAFADTLSLRFVRIQFTPDLMPADIVGTDILEDQETGKRAFRFQPGPIFANLILADEINRATPKTQSALLEAMQERTVSVLGRTYATSKPFFVLATQNPIEMEGTYPLPEAQLDRFMFKLNVSFPKLDELTAIVEQTTGEKSTRATKVTDGNTLIAMGQFARQVPAASHVTRYAAALVSATHPDGEGATHVVKKYVRYGASPRGAQALLLGGRVLALLNGRFNVAIEDLKALAPAALRHRILLNFEGQAEGINPDDVIADVTAKVKAS